MLRLRAPLGALLVTAALATRGAAAEPPPLSPRAFLATIQPSPELQAFLDRTVDALTASDPALARTDARVALLDLGDGGAPPRLAERRGRSPIYPASVIKFVYLMAAYAWQAEGRLRIDPELDRQLTEMIHDSSNQATQRVVGRITGTVPGPELPPDAYRDFRERRLAVERWVRSLGVTGLHCVNPTYDGGGDLAGRDRQFLRDRTVEGGLPSDDGEYPNRNGMTAVGTAELLALLATDQALAATDAATVRRRMRRDPVEQPHLVHRIAGGAARVGGLEVYAKSGTWGPIYADAGIVRQVASGRQLVLVALTQGNPPYRGDFIANLTERAARHLLAGR
ncbi:MAG: serine hydrolase [Candidatus Binatia bacterium]